ncbi:hypothetical protein [Lederbergia citrea]|uniref:Uncharacterized protein n=1 Tax=Lederbergia citrea TaxID=2833581 RepID=A0A942Z2E8_9BACI|nr:hypothetical protein [Lederbergia citrea]MBS4204031.1 hypothetical protein [Lederbergia citrea]MBS4221384.1 hypothetical protein [Lederbergia citrea]
MINRLIHMLIITIGQWSQFGGIQYERQFESIMNQLQEELGLDWDETVSFLEHVMANKEDAA